jgi:hypothetical protein
MVYRTLFREARDWCTVQYFEGGGTVVESSIYLGEGPVHRRVFREGRYSCRVQYLERESICVTFSIS